MRILIVEDEPAVAEMLAEVLRWLGHEVDIVGDGREVLGRTTTASYDALLLDVCMPGTSGLTVFETLRDRNPSLADRTLFLTGAVDTPLTAQLSRLGRPILGKPFNVTELAQTLEAVALQVA